MKNGIDISYVQKGIDLNSVKAAGKEFVIIRAGISLRRDTELEAHARGAAEAGIPYGFYWFSRAFSVEDARNEARVCLDAIKDYSPDYPVFYDMEDGDQIEALDKEIRTDIITEFCEKVKAAGYTAGVYINPSWLESYVDKSRLTDRYEIWLAHWTGSPDKNTSYNYGQIMWQWGVENIDGYEADADICYKDYGDNSSGGGGDGDKMLPLGSEAFFSGGFQYRASTADIGVPAFPGKVRISNRAKGATHPYHVISLDGSGTYGWVNASELKSDNNGGGGYRAGQAVMLENAGLYAAAGSQTPVRYISGIFYLYDGTDINGYFRICYALENVGRIPVGENVLGWVRRSELGRI